MLEAAPHFGIWPWGPLLLVCGWFLLCVLLPLHVFTRQLVAIFEHPFTFAEGLVIPKLARVEHAIRKDPLTACDLALIPLSYKFRSIFCVTVSSRSTSHEPAPPA